jgi:lysyl-tRNA synthetase class I
MTFEELKTEANRQGYNLIKKQPYISLNKCPECGRKPSQWFKYVSGLHLTAFQCQCGHHPEWSKTDRDARLKWNLYVEELLEDLKCRK